MLEKCTIFAIMISFFIFIGKAYIPNSVNAAENHTILHQQLNQLLKNENDLNGAIAGISIRSGLSGQLIYDHFGGIRLRPASNLKLLNEVT